jgi:hypothetical protein
MNKVVKRLGLVLAFAAVLVSCSTERTREDKVAAMINEIDAPFFVANTVTKNLIDKSGALDGALPFTYEMLINFFIDESVTGVDYETDIQIVVGKGASFLPNFYGIFKIKNEATFIELLETEANAEIKEKDGYKYVVKSNDQYVIVWNEEFAVASNIPMDFSDMFSGGGGAKQGDKAVNKAIAVIDASAKGDINETFATFLKKDADISMYFEGKGFYAYLTDMAMGDEDELEESRDIIEGFNCEMALNFNEGSIDLTFISHLADEVKERLSFFNEGAVSSKYLKFGDSENPLVSLQYNANIKHYLDFAKEQMDERDYNRMEEDLNEFGLSVEDVKSAMTGEFVFMLSRIETREEVVDYGFGDPYTRTITDPVFGIVAGVSSKAVVEKALAESVQLGEDMYKNGDAYLYLSDEFLFASGDSAWTMRIAEGKGVQIKDDKSVLTTSAFGVFVDLLKIGKMEEMQNGDMTVLFSMLEAATVSGNLEEMVMQVLLKDKSKNALRILTETLGNFSNGIDQAGQEALEEELEEAVVEEDLGQVMELLEEAN